MKDRNGYKPIPVGTTGGWEKVGDRPLFGGAMGTVFDCYVIPEAGCYKMWYSWRPAQAIVYATSQDGAEWSLPRVALTRLPDSGWEADEVSRPTLIQKDGLYHMWYTGHRWEGNASACAIGYAVSEDGIHWERPYKQPVLEPELPWERSMIWCPHVIYEADTGRYRMWYSGGATPRGEADAIGYAESDDGIHWRKHPGNPVFTPDANHQWEMYKVSAGYVWKRDGWHYMTYLGSDSDMRAQSGLARSRDGVTGWQRHPSNPVIAGTEGSWDCLGICKVTVLEADDGYIGWYNGFNNRIEEMGLVRHRGFDLGFPEEGRAGINERGERPSRPLINPVW